MFDTFLPFGCARGYSLACWFFNLCEKDTGATVHTKLVASLGWTLGARVPEAGVGLFCNDRGKWKG